MPSTAQLEPKRSRGHARRVCRHPSQFFRTKKASTAAFTGATCYELSSIYSDSLTHIASANTGQLASRDRITGFNRPSAQTSYSYDANSNRSNALIKTTSDSDLDGDFDQADKAQTNAQA